MLPKNLVNYQFFRKNNNKIVLFLNKNGETIFKNIKKYKLSKSFKTSFENNKNNTF